MEQEAKKVLSPKFIAEKWVGKALEELKKIDDIYSVVYENTPYSWGIERSLALSSIGNQKFFQSLADSGVTKGQIKMAMPNILQAVSNGLTYRGFQETPSTNNEPWQIKQSSDLEGLLSKSNQKSQPSQSSEPLMTQVPQATQNLSDLLLVPTDEKKKPLKAEVRKQSLSPLLGQPNLPNQTLAELLTRSRK